MRGIIGTSSAFGELHSFCPNIEASTPMHCVLTADLASLVSEHGPAIIRGRSTFAPTAVAGYWASSRNRFELWHQTLARYRRAEKSGEFHALRDWWRDHVVVLEEVLVTEILTRADRSPGSNH